jgi:hypothetical protein
MIRTIDLLVSHKAVFRSFTCPKLLVSKEVVGAKGFEPSTSWFRTRDKNDLSRCVGVSYGFLGRSLLDKFGQVGFPAFIEI